MLIFNHGETMKEIKIEIVNWDCLERGDWFKVKIFDAKNGAIISRKDFCMVHIDGDLHTKKELERIEELVNHFSNNSFRPNYYDEFKKHISMSDGLSQNSSDLSLI